MEQVPEPGRRRVEGGGRLVVVIIVLLIANMAVLGFAVIDSNLKVYRLSGEIDALQLELNSTNAELRSLREDLNASRVPVSMPAQGLQLTEIYNRTRISVVLIQVETPLGQAQGSGFVYDAEGLIVTNNHVVEDASRIEVAFVDGTVARAELVGADPYVDMAVLRVRVDRGLLRPLPLGRSSALAVGEQVVAIGNPFGLANTLTSGVVSAVARQMTAPGGFSIVDVIQTDAAINPGNSGGPLLNMRGEVVGMNTAIVSETRQFSGVGFAIPSDTIRRELPVILSTGTYQHPFLGITGADITPAIAEAMGLDKATRGALVVEIRAGSPAEKAGLVGGTRETTVDGDRVRLGGDVIIGVEGQPVKSLYDLIVFLERSHRPGDTIRLTIIRSNRVMDLRLVLGARPPPLAPR